MAATPCSGKAAVAERRRDLNGDGSANALDRQILFANTGFTANCAPATTELPQLATHADLATTTPLSAIADDDQGDPVFFRELGAANGSARIGADGQTLIFSPEPGYVGAATITVEADDGYNAGNPIELTGERQQRSARRHPPRADRQAAGGTDCATQSHPRLRRRAKRHPSDASYLHVTTADLADLGDAGPGAVEVDHASDQILRQRRRPGADRRAAHRPRWTPDPGGYGNQRRARAVAGRCGLPRAKAANPDPSFLPARRLSLHADAHSRQHAPAQGASGGPASEAADIHTARQLAFAGVPEQVDSSLDPDPRRH